MALEWVPIVHLSGVIVLSERHEKLRVAKVASGCQDDFSREISWEWPFCYIVEHDFTNQFLILHASWARWWAHWGLGCKQVKPLSALGWAWLIYQVRRAQARVQVLFYEIKPAGEAAHLVKHDQLNFVFIEFSVWMKWTQLLQLASVSI